MNNYQKERCNEYRNYLWLCMYVDSNRHIDINRISQLLKRSYLNIYREINYIDR